MECSAELTLIPPTRVLVLEVALGGLSPPAWNPLLPRAMDGGKFRAGPHPRWRWVTSSGARAGGWGLQDPAWGAPPLRRSGWAPRILKPPPLPAGGGRRPCFGWGKASALPPPRIPPPPPASSTASSPEGAVRGRGRASPSRSQSRGLRVGVGRGRKAAPPPIRWTPEGALLVLGLAVVPRRRPPGGLGQLHRVPAAAGGAGAAASVTQPLPWAAL